MASGVFNIGATSIGDGAIDFLTGTIKVMLIGTATAYVFEPDNANLGVASGPSASELSVTGYATGFASADRRTLASKTVASDLTNNRTTFDAADPAAWTLSTGGTVAAAVVYHHLTSDALSVPLFYLDFTDVPTNGSTFTLAFAATGIGYLQNG
ncbi:MAG: hypothetical protein H0U59_00745 [Gemmatimonadaceae bacterium]|nr:hypothetical protein [Gemmatimonadaceae bacterium]